MPIQGMLSLLAGLGNGYNKGTQQQFENDRDTKLDQIKLDRAAQEATEFAQMQQDRTALRAAGAPVVATPDTVVDANGNTVQRMVKPDTMDNADVGQPGEAPVTTPAMRVGMQGMLAPAAVPGALAAQNTPDAIRMRQMAVIAQQNPEKAATLQAADLRMKAATIEQSQQQFDSQLNDAAKSGWDSLGKFMDDSPSSPSKGKWVPSEDGKKMRAYKADPTSGALVPTGVEFDNSPSGLADAAQFFSKSVPITAKVAHFTAQQAEDRKEKHDQATEEYQRGMLGVAQQNAATTEGYRKDMGAAALTKADRPAGGGNAVDRMSEADKLTFGDINKQRETINAAITKAQAEGAWDDKSPNAQTLLTRQRALSMQGQALLKKYQSDDAAAAADPLGVRKAATGGSERVVSPATQRSRDTDRVPILVAEWEKATDLSDKEAIAREIGRLPQTLQADAQSRMRATSVKPMQTVAAQARPPAAAPVAAPAQPAAAPTGMLDRIGGYLSASGVDYSTPQGKAQLAARVAEASRGGPPLTDVESLRARQLGIV